MMQSEHSPLPEAAIFLEASKRRMSIWRWADYFDSVPDAVQITLGEGDTPLVRSKQIGARVGLNNLYFKLESCNPTGSYKDRFAATAISHMVAEDSYECVACSSGNTGSALAAYCAAVPNMRCRLAIVEPAPDGKLRQMLAYGADVFRVRGFGLDLQVTKDVFDGLERLGSLPGAAFQISAFKWCPKGMSGVQTISCELAEQSDRPIDHVFCPAGGGGLMLAVARGFRLLEQRGVISKTPAIECVQPEGNDTTAGPMREGAKVAHPCETSTTISGLQVGTVNDGDEVIRECRPTGGTGHLVRDEDVWEAQAQLAVEEGIFCEPAGAVALAGALKANTGRELDRDAVVVCLVTGIGFKDEPSIDRMNSKRECDMVEFKEFATAVQGG